MSPEQLALPMERKPYYEDWYERLLAELGRITTVISLKEMSYAVDAKASTLHQALTQRDDRQFQARWLGPYLYKAPDLELVTVLTEPAGVDIAKRKPRSPEEQLAKTWQAIAKVCGPMIAQAIEEEAKR